VNLTTAPHRQVAALAEARHGTSLKTSSRAWATIRNLRRSRNRRLPGALGRKVPVHEPSRGSNFGVPKRRPRLEAPARTPLIPESLTTRAPLCRPANSPSASNPPFDHRAPVDPAARDPRCPLPPDRLPDQPSSGRSRTDHPVVVPSRGGTLRSAHRRQRQPCPVRFHDRIRPLPIDHAAASPFVPTLQ